MKTFSSRTSFDSGTRCANAGSPRNVLSTVPRRQPMDCRHHHHDRSPHRNVSFRMSESNWDAPRSTSSAYSAVRSAASTPRNAFHIWPRSEHGARFCSSPVLSPSPCSLECDEAGSTFGSASDPRGRPYTITSRLSSRQRAYSPSVWRSPPSSDRYSQRKCTALVDQHRGSYRLRDRHAAAPGSAAATARSTQRRHHDTLESYITQCASQGALHAPTCASVGVTGTFMSAARACLFPDARR